MSMIDYLRYFFNFPHLLDLQPPLMKPRALLILAIVFGLCIAIGIASRIKTKRARNGLAIKTHRKITACGLTLGIVGFLYLLAAYEGAALLSALFWFMIWLIVGIVWAGSIINYTVRVIPKKRQELERHREFAKYLP